KTRNGCDGQRFSWPSWALFRRVGLRTRQPGILPLTRRQNFARGENFDAENTAFRIDVVDEWPGFLGAIDPAAAQVDIGGIGFRIVGHVDHRFRLAFLSNMTLITGISE